MDLFYEKVSHGIADTPTLHHATAEDLYMIGPIADSQPARDNESEHAELAGQGTDLVNFMVRGDEAGLSDIVKAFLMWMRLWVLRTPSTKPWLKIYRTLRRRLLKSLGSRDWPEERDWPG